MLTQFAFLFFAVYLVFDFFFNDWGYFPKIDETIRKNNIIDWGNNTYCPRSRSLAKGGSSTNEW